MQTRATEQLAHQFEADGAVVILRDEIPLSTEQWRSVEAIVRDIEYARIVGGDTGDAHSVWVGRFVNDVDRPQLLHDSSEQLLNVLFSDPMQRFFGQIIGAQPLCVRRCQANRLFVGDFIGHHIDRDTTPDYLATAIFQLSDAFEGGEFVLYHPERGQYTVNLPKYSLVLNRGDIPHEVLPVQHGMRQSLACFFSTNFGPTHKPRTDFKIDPGEAR
ncbi:MAG: 2OG-Fe(II) oxygenase [Gammaproteobacteria bacterium]|jgi:hypothetical protein